MNSCIVSNIPKEYYHVTGINRYSYYLLKTLKSVHNILLIRTQEITKFKAFQVYPLHYPFKKMYSDVFHLTCQTFAIPLLWQKFKNPVIVTVHDIIPHVCNEYSSYADKILHFFAMKGLKKATHIITDSEHTKNDLINYLHIPKEKITVIYLGVDSHLFFPQKIKRKQNTILYVGSESKRKNLTVLFHAIKVVKKIIPDIKLIKIGTPQDQYQHKRLQLLAKELNIEPNIVWKGYVENLAEEYRNASLFLFPSLYEGFGFPVLEAMACGCPVICSNKTSLPEIAGDAAISFDGYNYQDLANKIIKVLSDKKMQKLMTVNGIQQAKQFTWEKCAKETTKIYKKVYDEYYK
ncbi:MAG: glycosyltransferase family 1 protein [Candidatus Woesearchaeota archaeon]|jgi:glycosyltransferase involved in cell wall biosynthesis